MADSDSLQLKALLEPLVTRMGYQLWGMEFRVAKHSALLRLFIDSEQGITLDDCTEVSRQVSALMDVEDPIQVPYTLEVSSPAWIGPCSRPTTTPATWVSRYGCVPSGPSTGSATSLA